MVASIGPFWDANETWLVLGVGILLVAFPKAHGLVLGELYLPVALMLIGLIAARRGVRLPRQGARQPQADLGPRCSSPARRWPRCRRAGCSGATSAASAAAGTTRCSPPRSRVALPMAYVLMGAGLAGHEDRGRAAASAPCSGRKHRLGADGRRPGADLDGHALDQRDGARALVRAARDHRADARSR